MLCTAGPQKQSDVAVLLHGSGNLGGGSGSSGSSSSRRMGPKGVQEKK